MSLIVDASIVVKWFVGEEGSSDARALFEAGDEFIAPSLVVAEVGNAFRKKVRGNAITAEQAQTALQSLPKFLARYVDLDELVSRALEISLHLSHPIYDCFYLVLAERENIPIVSADAKMIAGGKRLGTIDIRKL
jgi:predicted nucleic acid-binding protein